MSTTVARWVLVGTAVVLVLSGTLIALPGVGRAALLAAGTCCAALDIVVARSARLETDPDAVVVVPPPEGPPTTGDEAAVPSRPAPDPSDPPDVPDAGDARTELDLGRTLDGARVAVSTLARTHVAVVGSGALALAVHRAVAAQLGALDGCAELRSVIAPDLVEAPGADVCAPSTVPPLPAGTAVAVALGTDGIVRASAVLVPGDGQRPRRADVVVHVSRYGCTVSLPGERICVPIDPVLPMLRER